MRLVKIAQTRTEGSLKLGASRFADMTPNEMQTLLNYPIVKFQKALLEEAVSDVPDTLDWRDHDMVSPVKD